MHLSLGGLRWTLTRRDGGDVDCTAWTRVITPPLLSSHLPVFQTLSGVGPTPDVCNLVHNLRVYTSRFRFKKLVSSILLGAWWSICGAAATNGPGSGRAVWGPRISSRAFGAKYLRLPLRPKAARDKLSLSLSFFRMER